MYYPDSVTAIHSKLLKSAGLPHLRNLGAPERRRRENRLQHLGSLRRRLHPPHLHPRHHKNAGGIRGHNGKADWSECTSKIYVAISKRGRGTARSTVFYYPTLSAPDSRWGQKWVRKTVTLSKTAKKVPDFPIFSGNPAGFGAGCEIRTRDLMITNCNRHKNSGISKAFRPFSLQNQQLVHAIRPTVSARTFPPVGQLVGQPTFRTESGLDDSDKSLERGTKKAFRGLHSNSEWQKSQAFNIWTAISKKSFSLSARYRPKQSSNHAPSNSAGDPLQFLGGELY